ncbi:MAG: cadherin-like beta sandwich domain-containing protein [Verrucomicrobiota bacterium]
MVVAEMISLPQLVPMADQTVLVGQPVSFTLNATNGTGPFTYQWQLDGSEIAGATTSVYSIAAAAQADAGIYIGLVTGPAGTVTNSATLTVHVLPEVTAWPVAASIVYGQTLASSLLTGGTATPEGSFDWATPATALDSGTFDQSVTFTPTDTANYATTNWTVSVTVARATPSVTTWPTASTITLGQALSASTLTGGSASVVGYYAFTLPATIPPRGTNNQNVTFTATNAANYNVVTGSVAVVVIGPPTVTTLAATNILGTGATLNSSVDPGGLADAFFQYGTSTNMDEGVSTLAGSATAGYYNSTGVNARFNYPYGLAVDGSDNVYVGDLLNHMIRKISPAGVVTTMSGSGGTVYADGPAATAAIGTPVCLVLHTDGVMYMVDKDFNRIRKVAADGSVTTLAGSGTAGFVDGSSGVAQFSNPTGLAVDPSGNTYVADMANNRIRKVTPAGDVTTLAGSGARSFADGGGANAAFWSPAGVVVDAGGNLYVTDSNNKRIRKVTATGSVTTLAGSATGGYADGFGATAQFAGIGAMAFNASGEIYLVDSDRIRKVTPLGMVTTLSGSTTPGYLDGPLAVAKFNSPGGVAVSPSGAIYVADVYNHRIRKIAIGLPLVLAQAGVAGTHFVPVSLSVTGLIPETTYYFRAVTTNVAGTVTGNILSFTTPSTNALLANLVLSTGTLSPGFASNTTSYAASVSNSTASITVTPTVVKSNALVKVNGTTVASGAASGAINLTFGTNSITVDVTAQDGVTTNLYTVSVWRMPPPPSVTTLAASGVLSSGATLNASVNPNGGSTRAAFWFGASTNGLPTVSTLAGDGTGGYAEGVGILARFYGPAGVAVDGPGNVYVADRFNYRIRKVSPGGLVTTLAGKGTEGFADGAGADAMFNGSVGVAVDGAGNVYVSDVVNSRIRKVTPEGVVSTLAGSGTAGFADGPGVTAQFNTPMGVAVDASGNVYVGDVANNCVRKISPVGDVTTLAGSSTRGYLDGMGTNAQF